MKTWQERVRRVVPYVAGEQPKDPSIIKLNTNECPYPPSPAVRAALERAAEESDRLRLYPDMDATPLVQALSAKYGVSPDRIFVGVGSDDVLAMSFLTFFTGGGELLFPDITYSFYDVWAELYRIPYRRIPLREDFTIDPGDYLPRSGEDKSAASPCGETAPWNRQPQSGTRGDVCGIIFPNPNAPTGAALPLSDIERIVAANPDRVVIVDEAYIDFGAQTALPLLEYYDNLLIVQTFSKSRAMAGARIGFAIGSSALIRALKDIKFSFNSYTMSLPAILAGTAAVEDDVYFRRITGKIISTREWFARELSDFGFRFPPSEANFVFVRHPEVIGQDLYEQLRARGILVRHWNKPRISDHLRITIGTDEQMSAVVKALREILM